MNPRRLLVWLGLLLISTQGAGFSYADDDPQAAQAVLLLRNKCVPCHGPDMNEGALRLDSRNGLLVGGDHGPAVVEGKSADSLLYQSVAGIAPQALRMPPENPLREDEVALLRAWLDQGAPWNPSTTSPSTPNPTDLLDSSETIGDAWTDPRNPIVQIFGGERLDLWSVKPIQYPSVPDGVQESWCHNELDRFVAARLEASQLPLPAMADRHTLIRRLHFDLSGLPPSPQTAATFEFTDEPRAYEAMVDQLLEANTFGIHWARMWLDVVRYSDSNGFDWDEFRPQAYRYRDYVIRALNQDKPYHQFLREQLAGDESFDGPPRDVAQQDALIATGFLRMGPHDSAASLFNEQERSRDELLVDLVETTGGAFMGLTLSCCRCHDHKFDPVSQADYFRLRAYFAGVQFADDLPIDLAETQDAMQQHNAAVEQRVAGLRAEAEQILLSIRQRTESQSPPPASDQNKAEASTPIGQDPAFIKKWLALAVSEEKERWKANEQAIQAALQDKRQPTHAMVMTDTEKPAPTYIHFQGDHKSPRGQVEPGVLSILDPNRRSASPVLRLGSSGRRTALAEWIISPKNPLTSRVIVNRVWQNLMGQGLVATPGDFGFAGIPPADPALLDWLSRRFMEEGWSLKWLVRTIVLSSTYRQSASFHDVPETVSYAIRRPRRLTAEQLRDAMLMVSGLMTDQASGPPQWPELPREVLEANPAFLDDNETKTKGWYTSESASQHCRSIFLVQKRNTRVPLLETLDQPENSVPCQRRWTSIVAPQALSLLNSPESVEAARHFATRIEATSSNPRERVEAAFELALQRKPSPSELQACQRFVERFDWLELARVLLNLNEFAYLD